MGNPTIPHTQPSPPSPKTHSIIPPMPPPPYFQLRPIKPSDFQSTINASLDKPLVFLFNLGTSTLQLIFALASGISYAIELQHLQQLQQLQHNNTNLRTNLIYAQVVFGLSLVALIIEAMTVRTYRFVWMSRWMLSVLYFAMFGVFFDVCYNGGGTGGYGGTDIGRMERAVWCDLINALLWMGSALFSSAMCCSGTKAAIQGKFDRRRQRKEMEKIEGMEEMETGYVHV